MQFTKLNVNNKFVNFGAYLTDILVRGFFIFVAVDLWLRQWWWAALLAIIINVVFEVVFRRQNWRQFREAPKKKRRSWRVLARDLWTRLFSRQRTKGLLWTGITLLIMSYFVKLNVYYVVCACVVFSLAAISRFAPPEKSATITCEQNGDQATSPTVSTTIASK